MTKTPLLVIMSVNCDVVSFALLPSSCLSAVRQSQELIDLINNIRNGHRFRISVLFDNPSTVLIQDQALEVLEACQNSSCLGYCETTAILAHVLEQSRNVTLHQCLFGSQVVISYH